MIIIASQEVEDLCVSCMQGRLPEKGHFEPVGAKNELMIAKLTFTAGIWRRYVAKLMSGANLESGDPPRQTPTTLLSAAVLQPAAGIHTMIWSITKILKLVGRVGAPYMISNVKEMRKELASTMRTETGATITVKTTAMSTIMMTRIRLGLTTLSTRQTCTVKTLQELDEPRAW